MKIFRVEWYVPEIGSVMPRVTYGFQQQSMQNPYETPLISPLVHHKLFSSQQSAEIFQGNLKNCAKTLNIKNLVITSLEVAVDAE